MERTLRRVERWLERCMEACRLRRWTAALAEIECARVELESARKELWDLAGGEDRRAGRAVRFLKGACAGALLLLGTACPVAIEERMSEIALEPLGLETMPLFVTRDERALIDLLRRDLSDGAVRATGVSAAVARTTVRQDMRERPRFVPARDIASEAGNVRDADIIDVSTLVRVGERALRGPSVPVVVGERTE